MLFRSLGIEFWAAVELGYAPKVSNSEKDAKLDFVANAKAMNALLEETSEWETFTMNQLLGNLAAYEMRLPQRKSNMREAAFKAEKSKEEKEDTCSCSDEEEAKFVKRLDRGSSKYKGKLPFKSFNCGRVGHYASKCPHKKSKNQTQETEKTKTNN